MPRKQSKTRRKNRESLIGNPRLLSIKKASERYGLSVWALRELIWAGKVPVVQFEEPNGKMWLDTNDMEQLITNHKRVIT